MTSSQAETHPLQVLIVDDDPQMLRTITDILRLNGYAPSGATTGLGGLELAAKMDDSPAIALVDLSLPDMDGIEVVARLHALSALTQVVILTGNASVDSAVRALREQSYDYLIKPVQPDHLLATLERAGERSYRRRAEEGMRESEERMRQIFAHVSDALFIVDDSGIIVDANPAATTLTGRSLDQLHSTPLSEVLPEVSSVPEEAADGRSPLPMPVTGNQATRVLDIQSARFAPGVRVYTVRDLTKQRQLEEELNQSRKMDAIGQLAGGVAHDFNNLLTVIMSYSSLLLGDIEPTDPRRQDVQEISDAAERAAALTGQLLAFSRKQVMHTRPISINTVVSGLEKMLRRLIGEHIELLISLGDPLHLVNADPGQLEQVIINLAVNARDAMHNGGKLRIATSNAALPPASRGKRAEPSANGHVMIEVKDNGIGMTHEIQQRIFEPFFTTKEQGKGTGLGLATVYGIVTQSGGEVRLHSEPNRGTTFRIFFPALATAAESVPAVAETHNAPRGDETVLIVEDDASLRALAARVLESSGYKVLLARNGVEALALCAGYDGRIDLVASDVVMPEMSGRPLVEKLAETRAETRVLFMSGYTDDDVMRRGVLDGRTAFIQKPFTATQFATKVRDVLDQPRRNGTS
jgi:two-component system, cell cycle sensor histidine kinase and response regulator CckA